MRVQFPHLASRVLTIYNGFHYRKCPESEIACDTGRLNLVAIGRITPSKNIINLVRAVANAQRQGLAVRLDWIGRLDNDRWTTGFYHEVSTIVDTLAVGDGWRWLGERKDVADLLPRYHALIHPSFFEGLPNAVCEAFAAGIPVLAGNVCDHPKLVDSPIRGLLFDPNRPESISNSMLHFASLSQDERRAMGVAARAYFDHELATNRMCASFEALL